MKIFDYADLGGKRSWYYAEKGITPESEGIGPILETDKEIEFGSLLIINNIAYRICCMAGKTSKIQCAYAERVKEQNVFVYGEDPKDRDYTHEITCPYCGAEIESWEMGDEDDEYECEYCSSTFSYQRIVTVQYCSQPVKKASFIKLN